MADTKDKSGAEKILGSFVPVVRGLYADKVRKAGDGFGDILIKNIPRARGPMQEKLVGAILQTAESNKPKHWLAGEVFESVIDILERGFNEYFEAGEKYLDGKVPATREVKPPPGLDELRKDLHEWVMEQFSEVDPDEFESLLDWVVMIYRRRLEVEAKLDELDGAEAERRRPLTADDYDESTLKDNLLELATRVEAKVYPSWTNAKIVEAIDEKLGVVRKPEQESTDLAVTLNNARRSVQSYREERRRRRAEAQEKTKEEVLT